MITVTVEKINGVALSSGANTKYKIDRSMLARAPQPLTADTLSSKCKLWINQRYGEEVKTEEWLVTETFTAVTDALTADTAADGAISTSNIATTFGTLNDTLVPSTEAVSENFQGRWYVQTPAPQDATYSGTLTPAPTAYFAGMQIYVRFSTTNTGAATFNANSLGAKDIKKGTAGATALSASDLIVGKIYTLLYDGTNFQINL